MGFYVHYQYVVAFATLRPREMKCVVETSPKQETSTYIGVRGVEEYK
jgi:hypothetical protein